MILLAFVEMDMWLDEKKKSLQSFTLYRQ